MENSFIPQGYVQPTSAGGFSKLETGENKFRILSSPQMIWLEWRDGKPVRHPFANGVAKPAKGAGQNDSVKHAWGLIVWNYKTKSIEVLELDKQDVISTLLALSEKPAWGHPKKYDIVITKKGSGLDTEYQTTPEPPSEPSDEIIEAFTETPVDLSQLLVPNGNPFIGKNQAANPANPNAQPAASAAKVVTPENWVSGDQLPQGWVLNAEGTAIEKKPLPF